MENKKKETIANRERISLWVLVGMALMLTFMSQGSYAMQENRNALCTIDSVAPKGKEKPDDGTIFDRYYYERMPEFLGGQTKLMKYIDSCVVSFLSPLDKVNYPQGRVIVQFLVEADGSITHAKVMRGVHPDLDKEALRIINAMPKWRPGEVNGKKTAVKFTAPIIFKRPTK